MTTSISWTDEVWNPTTGCTKVSPGCASCYIERTPPMRMAGRKFVKGHIPLQLHEDRLTKPLSWKKPRRVFVNSMSDLFHDDIPDEFIDRAFATMAMCPQHTFQVLTKRAKRMRDYMTEATREGGRWDHLLYDGRFEWPTDHIAQVDIGYERITSEVPLNNVWLGVSVEDQQRADERIPLLLQTPAAVPFLSCEPLLSALDLRQWIGPHCICDKSSEPTPCDKYMKTGRCPNTPSRVGWVIVGGESGPNARHCDVGDIRSVVAQCRAASVPCFVKQLGSRPFDLAYRGNGRTYTREAIDARGDVCDEAVSELGKILDSAAYLNLRDKKGGDWEEWPEDLRVREFPKAVPG